MTGCRQPSLQGCVKQTYELYTTCQCPSAEDCPSGNFDCFSQYRLSNASCYSQYNSTSGSTRRSLPAEDDPSQVANQLNARDGSSCRVQGSDVFDLADVNKSGNLSLTEYLAVINMTTGGSLTAVSAQRWIRRFTLFDQNHNGFVSSDEAHRILRPPKVFGA